MNFMHRKSKPQHRERTDQPTTASEDMDKDEDTVTDRRNAMVHVQPIYLRGMSILTPRYH